MIFEVPETADEPCDAGNVQHKLRAILFLFTDHLLDVAERARNGEDIPASMLNVIRQFLKDMDISYKSAMNEQKAQALMQSLSDLPDFTYFKSRFQKPDDDKKN